MVITAPFFIQRHPRTLFLSSFSRLRGNPAQETGTFLKFLEISEIKDFEDDGVWENYEDDVGGGYFKDDCKKNKSGLAIDFAAVLTFLSPELFIKFLALSASQRP